MPSGPGEATRIPGGGARVSGDSIDRVFERAPVLTERLRSAGPFGSADEILAGAREAVARMSDAEKVAVLDAHPRIGADPATLSAASHAEQGGGSGADDPRVLRKLTELNDAYERRFGFRFVVFVNGRPKAELVTVLRARLGRGRDDELATGMSEFLAIARDRLERG